MRGDPAQHMMIPSLLDRLKGEYGETGGGQLLQSLDELQQAVRRDVERLLNTRWRTVHWPHDLPELERSLASYGIPDFSAAALGSPDNREKLRIAIERALAIHEPRFQNVRVHLVDRPTLDRTLHFRIEADLLAFPHSEAIAFDSRIEPLSNQIRVQRATS